MFCFLVFFRGFHWARSGGSVTVTKQEEKIIRPFHWPKLKYNFITKNIIQTILYEIKFTYSG